MYTLDDIICVCHASEPQRCGSPVLLQPDQGVAPKKVIGSLSAISYQQLPYYQEYYNRGGGGYNTLATARSWLLVAGGNHMYRQCGSYTYTAISTFNKPEINVEHTSSRLREVCCKGHIGRSLNDG